jgi:Uma2 family endonuclease
MTHDISTVVPADLAAMTAGGANLIRMTVEQYHTMIGTAMMEGAPVELLDGLLVLKDRSHQGASPMSSYPPHVLSVTRISRLDRRLDGRGYHVRSQQSITLPPQNEPEPDASLVVGSIEDYANAHPGLQQVVCVFEVSDSSLRHDRTTKLRIYARAAIPQYVIVNLVDQVVEFRSDVDSATGSYRSTTVVKRGESFAIRLPDGALFEIRSDELLP